MNLWLIFGLFYVILIGLCTQGYIIDRRRFKPSPFDPPLPSPSVDALLLQHKGRAAVKAYRRESGISRRYAFRYLGQREIDLALPSLPEPSAKVVELAQRDLRLAAMKVYRAKTGSNVYEAGLMELHIRREQQRGVWGIAPGRIVSYR